MNEQPSYMKTLRLAPPQACNYLGIPAEAPVFLSSYICDAQRCPSCPVTYTPLVYAPGQVAEAQHWHHNGGGIYFYAVDPRSFPDPSAGFSGWLAQVEPLGRTWIEGDTAVRRGRAEAVIVRAISAWCMNKDLDGHEYTGAPHCAHLLEAGTLYHYPGSRYGWDSLLPVCSADGIDEEDTLLRFAVRDGTVYFSQP